MTRRCCLAAVIVFGLLNGGTAPGDDAQQIQGNYSGSLVLDVDREAADALIAAEEDLEDGQVAAGLSRLQELLDRPDDVLVQHGSSYVSLWEVVNRRIGRLPAGDLAAYQRVVRVQSEAALAAARQPLNPDALALLTDRYRHTPVGRESARILAALAVDRGDHVTAEVWIDHLRQHAPAVQLPAGLLRRQPVQNADVEPSEARDRASSTWSLDLGVAESARHAIEGAVAELDAQALNPMLTCRPLLIGQLIMTRTLTGLICVDAVSGKLLWEHPVACHAARLAAAPGTLNDPLRTSQISALLLRRLIRDSLEDELATDGESVFTLVTGDRSAENDSLRPANSLRAIDIATGKLRWELKPPPREGSRSARRAAARQARYFLGPPLIDGGRLLLPAQHGQNIELVALDRKSGQILWSVTLGQSVRDLWSRKNAGLDESQPEDRERQSTACLLSRSGSHLLFPTGAGAIACIDVARQRLVWAYRYPRRDLSGPAPSAGDETHFRQMPTRDAFVSAASWIVGETGVCLAPDADRILAFDLASGRLLWSRPRGDVFQVLADDSGLLLLVREAAVTAVSALNGLREWSTPVHRPLGQPIIDDGQLIIPVSESDFEIVRISDGTRIADTVNPGSDESLTVTPHPPPSLRLIRLRNLSGSENVIISQSATTLERVAPTATLDQDAPVARQRLELLLTPIAEWRRESSQLLGALRQLDSRVGLVDGLLVRVLEQLGLKRSLEQQVETLLYAMRRAEDDEDTESLRTLRQQLADLDSRGLYVTSSDGRHTCRLDRWVNLVDEEATRDQQVNPEDRRDSMSLQTSWKWPHVSPRVSEHQTSFGLSYLHRVPIDEQRPGIWSDVTVEVDRQGRMIQLHDAASTQPAVVLLPRESSVFRLQPRFLQAWSRGNMLLVRVGAEIVAFHRTQRGELSSSTSWPADGQTLSLLGHRTPLPTSLRELPDEAVPAWDTTSTGFEDVFGRDVGDVGPVRDRYLCYQRRGAIIALETDTGEELWRRTRWPVGTRCIGDDECVVVFHPEQPQTTVLDAYDGRTVRRWSLDDVLAPRAVTEAAPFSPRQINGTRALLTRTIEGHEHLQVIDLKDVQVLWTSQRPAGTLDFPIDDSRLGLAIPSADGNDCSLVLLDWTTGEQGREFEVAGPKELQTVRTFSDAHQRYVILSGRITDLPLQNVPQIHGGLNRPLVNGWLHAFDVDFGKTRWSQPLNNVAFPMVQPRHVPLLIVNDMSQPAGSQTPQGRLFCLDARSGERVVEVHQPTHVYYTLDAALDTGRIDVRLQGRTLRLDYLNGPASDRQ